MRKIYLAILGIFIFFMTVNVEAACTRDEIRKYKDAANKVDFDYKLDSEVEADRYYSFSISASNLNKYIYVSAPDGTNYFWSENDEDKMTSLSYYDNAKRIKFTIKTSAETNCPDTVLSSKTVTLPYYNDYSQYSVCQDIVDFSLCQRFKDTSHIKDDDEFMKAVEAYKKEGRDDLKVEEKKLLRDRTIYYFVLAIVLLIIIIIIVLMNKNKNKNRKKVKIEGLK